MLRTSIRKFSVDGFGRVKIGLKSEKLVKKLEKGDEVFTPYGPDKIKNIEKIPLAYGFGELVELNKMLISPENPVKIFDEWTLPKEVKKVEFVKCRSLYSISLEKYDTITINGNNVKTN